MCAPLTCGVRRKKPTSSDGGVVLTGLDSELSDADRKAEADDDVEGTYTSLTLIMTKHVYDSQTWLAVSRNSNDESEVDDSSSNAGPFTHPVLSYRWQTYYLRTGESNQGHLAVTTSKIKQNNTRRPAATS